LPFSRDYWSFVQEVHSPDDVPMQLLHSHEYSNAFRSFLSTCLVKDPTKRASISGLLNHQFLTITAPELKELKA